MSEAKQIYHVPVLLNESVDGMNIQPGGIYVDATFVIMAWKGWMPFWPIWAFPHITLTTPNVDSHSASRAN